MKALVLLLALAPAHAATVMLVVGCGNSFITSNGSSLHCSGVSGDVTESVSIYGASVATFGASHPGSGSLFGSVYLDGDYDLTFFGGVGSGVYQIFFTGSASADPL